MNNKDKRPSQIRALQDSIARIDTAIVELQMTRCRLVNILEVELENYEDLRDEGIRD